MLRCYKSKKNLQKACNIILENSLCYEDGAFRVWIKDFHCIKYIVLDHDKTRAIGALIVLHEESQRFGCNCGVFVAPEWRKIGAASTIIEYFLRRIPKECLYFKTWSASNFFNRLKEHGYSRVFYN